MEKMRKFLVWFWLLTKRLYKKPSFIALLLLIPVVVFGYSLAAQGNSGMMTIAVCCEDPADDFSAALRDELASSGGVIRFLTDLDKEEAEQMVCDGVVDALWIIHDDIRNDVMEYVSGSYAGQGFVTVVVREKTVPLMLANEKLSAKLFVRCARLCFLNYFRENAPEFDDMTDDQILTNFDNVQFADSLFSFSYVDPVSQQRALNYLMLPVRGILAILVLVSGFAASMYYISDQKEGLFSRVSLRHRPFAELLYQIICVGNVMLFVMIALLACGWHVGILKELLTSVMYVFCCAVFCCLLRLICRNTVALATVMSVLTVIMLVVCPVFVSIPALKTLGFLFPPTYYINAAYNWSYLVYMVYFGGIVGIVYKVLVRIFER